MNLLKETLDDLKSNGKTEEGVIWVGTDECEISWNNFKEVAANTEYDNGFGGAEVANDLMIVGDNWWMTRGEYDGSEWWDFHTQPKKPKKTVIANRLIGSYSWEPLEELQKLDE